MKKISPLAIAEYILASYPNKGVTPMKLQKLAYYAKVWTLVSGNDVVGADFQKWEFGPVNLDIYHAYKEFGAGVISSPPAVKPEMEKAQNALCTFILDNYINYSAFELSAMTHIEDPWIKTEKNAVISNTHIIDFYSKQPFAKNFKEFNLQKGPFHFLQNDTWHAFTLDMTADEATAFEAYPSYEEYVVQSKSAEEDFQEFFKDTFN
jgi:uncharacterized phage-associated protein